MAADLGISRKRITPSWKAPRRGCRGPILDFAEDEQDDQDHHNQPESTAWPVAPAFAVAPGWECAHQGEDEDDEKYSSDGHRSG